MTKRTMYLGDGAYVEWDEQSLILYTSNGIERANNVALEYHEIKRLLSFIEKTVPGFAR